MGWYIVACGLSVSNTLEYKESWKIKKKLENIMGQLLFLPHLWFRISRMTEIITFFHQSSSFAKNEISNWSSFLIRDYMIVRKTVTCNGRCTYMIRISTAIREDWENRSPFIFCYFSLQTEDDLFYIFFVFIGFLWSSLGLLILSEVGDVKLVGEPLA